ncbi:DUF333 domain-containing protein [Photobacterium leiognathi]|nr:DUF333 domain-containing protein [Photobacterium leiognathi]
MMKKLLLVVGLLLSGSVFAFGNPASDFCVQHGGHVEIRTPMGGDGEKGYCVFNDGSQCEEYAFMKGQCKPSGKTHAQKLVDHCVKKGGYATGNVCKFAKWNTTCDLEDFYNHKCNRKKGNRVY